VWADVFVVFGASWFESEFFLIDTKPFPWIYLCLLYWIDYFLRKTKFYRNGLH
jgi:hypothetical protein